jgi:hypothetical protein
MRTRRALLVALGAAALAAPSGASAATPRVEAMVVGASSVLAPPKAVRVPAARVKAGGKTCTIGPGTPLGVLVAVARSGGPPFHVRDFASCSRRATDAGGLFVDRIDGEANAGSDGWVYKVGHKAGTTGAADPSGPFGTGRGLRSGQRVLWFWCNLGANEHCPPTLEVSADPARAAPGAPVRVTVKAYDDDGHGAPAAGATVALGGANATAGPDGTATLTAPGAPGRYEVTASAPGDVSGFPAELEVG